MKYTDDSPVYKLKDERFFLGLCIHNADRRCIDIYFVNKGAEEIESLRMRLVEYCYKTNIKESEQQSYVEDWFYRIPPKEYNLLTAISLTDDEPGEYISSFEIMTGREKVIAECTINKENILSMSFDKDIPIIEKKGKKVSLESRTFLK